MEYQDDVVDDEPGEPVSEGVSDEPAAESEAESTVVESTAKEAKQAEYIALLESRVQGLETKSQQPDPEPEPEPKPFFSEEQLAEFSEEQQPLAKGMNEMMAEIRSLRTKAASFEESQEDAQFTQTVNNFISANPEMKKDEKKLTQVRDLIRKTWIEGNVQAQLEVIYGHVYGNKKKPAPAEPAAATAKPKRVAGRVETAKTTPKSVSRGFEEAKKLSLSTIDKLKK